MVVIYYFLALFLWLFGAIFLLILSLKQKYKISIPARFFLYKNPSFKPARVHFHACSFGEIRALKPLFDEFDDKAISVITKTGFDEAIKICENVRFLPFEIFLPFWLKKSKILVIFEAELWLMLVFMAKFKGAKVILINARISDRSYKRYLKFSFFYKRIFKYIDTVYAQSEIDKSRLEKLGANNIIVSGNIKSANTPSPTKIYEKPNGRLVVLASTHKGEEKLLLDGLELAESDSLVVAPRHPERFDEVAEILLNFSKFNNYEFAKFSKSGNFKTKITLLDTLGELVNLYAISDVVVLGGSFVPGVGGHNPVEIAVFNNALISGEYIHNQKALYALVSNVYFTKFNEISSLLKNDLKKCKVTHKVDLKMIINEIGKA